MADVARLWVALDLPEDVRAALAGWARGTLSPRERFIAPSALHLTLCFLGWMDAGEIGPIGAALRAAVADRATPVLELWQTVWLGGHFPSAFAVSVADRDGALPALQAAVARRLIDGGWYEAERRAFTPHVTVARVRGGSRRSTAEVPRIAPFPAPAVALYRSFNDPGGPRYVAQHRVALTPGSPSPS